VPASKVVACASDCVEANIKSYNEGLSYADHNGCMCHTLSHVAECMETALLDELTGYVVTMSAFSNYFCVRFCAFMGEAFHKIPGGFLRTSSTCSCYGSPPSSGRS